MDRGYGGRGLAYSFSATRITSESNDAFPNPLLQSSPLLWSSFNFKCDVIIIYHRGHIDLWTGKEEEEGKIYDIYRVKEEKLLHLRRTKASAGQLVLK